MKVLKQCAALPYLECDGRTLVLLITTRGRGRWSIPKGWPKAGMRDAALAAREAFEEAGVRGEVSERPIGYFEYTKRLHIFAWIRCRVEVYALRVDRQYIDWPERTSRKYSWVALEEAADLLKEPQLKALLRGFADAGGLFAPAGSELW
jgi:8-oxo-dGTP pyrophosphatase MutT (NUDIX family)